MRTLIGILLLAAVIIAGAVFYMASRYHTTRGCDALAAAVAEEVPQAIGDLSVKHADVLVARGLGELAGLSAEQQRAIAEEFIKKHKHVEGDFAGLKCTGALVMADFDRDGLREQIRHHLERDLGLDQTE